MNNFTIPSTWSPNIKEKIQAISAKRDAVKPELTNEERLNLLYVFRGKCLTFSRLICYYYSDIHQTEVLGINLAASSTIRKPFTLKRCKQIIDDLHLPLRIVDLSDTKFRIEIL